MKKKIMAILLIAVMTLSLVACGSGDSNSKAPSDNSEKVENTKTANKHIKISCKDFIDNYSELLSSLVKLEYVQDFSSEDMDIYEYRVSSNTITNGCTVDISHDDDVVQQILIQSSVGDAFTYFYATNAILSINPDADYESILEELNIAEDGHGEEGVYNSSQDCGDFVFTQTEDLCTLNIILE